MLICLMSDSFGDTRIRDVNAEGALIVSKDVKD